MVQCFVPECNHRSEKRTCKFYSFPKHKKVRERWTKLIRRADKEPTDHSRVCTCHFPEGKLKGPILFKRNEAEYSRRSVGLPTPCRDRFPSVTPSTPSEPSISREDAVAREDGPRPASQRTAKTPPDRPSPEGSLLPCTYTLSASKWPRSAPPPKRATPRARARANPNHNSKHNPPRKRANAQPPRSREHACTRRTFLSQSPPEPNQPERVPAGGWKGSLKPPHACEAVISPEGTIKILFSFPHLAKPLRVRSNSKELRPPRVEEEGQSPACAEERGDRSPEAAPSSTESEEREICPGVSTQTDGVPMFERVERAGVSTQTDGVRISERVERVMQEIELYNTKAELKALKEKQAYCRSVYSASQLSEEALRMETGITDRDTFNALMEHLSLSSTSISYSSGWSVKSLTLEDQVLLTLMKLKHKYVDLHLASLFHCSVSTVTNVTATFMAVLQSLPFKDIVATLPGRGKKHTFTPALFTTLAKLKLKPQVKGTCAKKSSQQTEAGAPSHPSVDLPPLRSESPAGNASPDPKRLCPTCGVFDCDKPGGWKGSLKPPHACEAVISPEGTIKILISFPHLAKPLRVRSNSKELCPPHVEEEGQTPACAEERGDRSPEAAPSSTKSEEREICPGVSTQTDGVPMFERVERAGISTQTDGVRISERVERVMQEIELSNTKAELKALKEKQAYCRSVYSASQLSEEALRMETGITDRDTFNALMEHLSRTSISYSSGWSVKKSLMLEDQVLLTLMKLNHKYVDRHLALLFHCSVSTVTNVTTTFMAVLQSLPCVKHMFTPALFTKLLNWKPQVKGTCAKKSSQQTEAGAPSHPSADLPPLRTESPAGNASPDPKRLCPTSGVLDCDKPGDQTLTNHP